MSFLRLGVQCAVIDDEERILLSRRGDLNIWNLPGGRLDSGELLARAAAREALEETGVVVHIERAVGLYYWAGWQRLNVLYAGWPLGGKLEQNTAETRENRYFVSHELPEMPWTVLALDAFAGTRHKPRVMTMSPVELRETRLKLRWRWVKNLLAGRPEPPFPRFEVQAVAVIWEDTYRRVLTLSDSRGHALPRVTCQGAIAPWTELADMVESTCGVSPAFRWVGMWQDRGRDKIEFIFAATVEETELIAEAEWSMARNAGLADRDAEYVERVRPSYARDAVWTLVHEPTLEQGEAVDVTRGRK